MKCIDDEIPFEIPEGWEWIRLSSIVSILGDGIHGTPEYDDAGDIFFINGNNLNNGKIIIKADTKRLNRTEANKHRRALDKNTILVSINGTIGNIAFYNNENIILGKSACYFNILGNIDKNYIKLIIESDYFISYAKSVATGSTIKNVPISGMRNFLVPLPPIKEQTRIVSRMSDLSVCINYYSRLQKEVNRLNHNIFTQFERSILQEAIQGKLVPQDQNDEPASVLLDRIREEKQRLLKEGKLKKKDITDSVIFKGDDNKYYEKIGNETVCIDEEIPFDIPQSWSWTRLQSICKITNGFTPLRSEDRFWKGGSINWFTVDDIREQGECITETKQRITEEATSEERIVRAGSVLLCCTASIGQCAITRIATTTNQQFNALTIKDEYRDIIDDEYLFIFAKTLKDELNRLAGTTTFAFVSVKKVGNILIPIPPIREQKRIVDIVKKSISSTTR